jgi:quercetin dioxygenase-like cupin family protein
VPQSAAADAGESHFVLGETLRPMLTNAMGSSIEIFDTKGVPGGGPPPHTHQWEEIYVVLSGEMDVVVDGKTTRLRAGGYAHVPANTPHGYTTIDETHFLTIVTRGNAAKFFRQVANEVEMNPPDIQGVLRVGAEHGITFLK